MFVGRKILKRVFAMNAIQSKFGRMGKPSIKSAIKGMT